MPTSVVYNVPRILRTSMSTADFFETVVCALKHTQHQIQAIDVLAFFLLDELSMGNFSPVGAFMSMIPKGYSRLYL